MSQNKIKIFSLTTTYPESLISTKPKFVHALNKELTKDGYDITVICPHSQYYPNKFEMDSVFIRFFRYLPQKFEIKNNSIPDEIKTKLGKLKTLIMFFGFFLFTLRLCYRDKNAILHGHWAFPAGYISYLVSRIFKKKFIVTVHGSEIPLIEKFHFLKKTVINSLNKSSKVVVGNNYLKDQLISMGVNKEKIVIIKPIPNFVNVPSNNELLENFKQKITEPEKKIILFIGRLTEVKGTEFLIRALSSVTTKNIHLIIVGDGILLKKLKKIGKLLGLENNITFFGSANNEELGKLFGISNLFVLPSIIDSRGGTEGTGLVILEAMAANLPVIASNVGGIKETIIDEVNGLLVNQKDPESIAIAIDKIFSNKSLRDRLINNSKNTINEFSPKIIADNYKIIFKNLIKR